MQVHIRHTPLLYGQDTPPWPDTRAYKKCFPRFLSSRKAFSIILVRLYCGATQTFLSANLLQFFHYREHEQGWDETQHDEHAPYTPQWKAAPEITSDTYKDVTYGCCHEPAAHHQSLILWRRYFWYERYTHRAEQQLAECKYKICCYKPVRRNKHSCVACGFLYIRAR